MSIAETAHDFIPLQPETRRKPLTSLEAARENHEILGVAVFILQAGKIFTVRENHTNHATGKREGDEGILSETLKDGETFEEGVIRCFEEELGIPKDKIGELFGVSPSAPCLGEGKASGVFGRGYQVELLGSEAELRGYIAGGDGEVSPVGFLSLQELRARRLRLATKLALEVHMPVRDTENNSLPPLSVENLVVRID